MAGRGELLGASSAGDGHACLPRALAVRAIDDDPAVSCDGGLLAQRARRCDACVETLVQQARTPTMSSTHGHVFLELRCASVSELAAAVVEHSVAIRVTSFEDLQLRWSWPQWSTTRRAPQGDRRQPPGPGQRSARRTQRHGDRTLFCPQSPHARSTSRLTTSACR